MKKILVGLAGFILMSSMLECEGKPFWKSKTKANAETEVTQQDVDNTTERIKNTQEQLERSANKLQQEQQKLNEISAEVSGEYQDFQENLAKINKQISGLEKEIKDAETALAKHERTIKKGGDSKSIKAKFKPLTEQEKFQRLSTAKQEKGKLEKQITVLKNQLGEANNEKDEILQKISELEKSFANVSDQQKKVAASEIALNEQNEEYNKLQKQQSKDIKSLQNRVCSLFSENNKKINSLYTALDKLRVSLRHSSELPDDSKGVTQSKTKSMKVYDVVQDLTDLCFFVWQSVSGLEDKVSAVNDVSEIVEQNDVKGPIDQKLNELENHTHALIKEYDDNDNGIFNQSSIIQSFDNFKVVDVGELYGKYEEIKKLATSSKTNNEDSQKMNSIISKHMSEVLDVIKGIENIPEFVSAVKTFIDEGGGTKQQLTDELDKILGKNATNN